VVLAQLPAIGALDLLRTIIQLNLQQRCRLVQTIVTGNRRPRRAALALMLLVFLMHALLLGVADARLARPSIQ